MRVGIVGAGIVGLATAAELLRQAPGTELRCYDAGEPLRARSVGTSRVFRTAHGDARLVRLARDAERSWRSWEERAGRPLLERTGVVVTGGNVDGWEAAMVAAGLDPAAADRPAFPLPLAAAGGRHLHDPLGGVVRVDDAGRFLLREVSAGGGEVRPGDVVSEVCGRAGGARLVAESGTWDCDVALVVAGGGTPALAAQVGVAVPRLERWHHRFTYPLRDPAGRPACWLDRSETWRRGFTSYQHLTAPGRWAVGGSLPVEDIDVALPEAEARRRAEAVVTAYVRDTLDGVVPEVTDVVRCRSLDRGDGLSAEAAGAVLVFWGDNLMKFAPVLGELLAACCRTGQVTDALAGLLVQASRTPPA